MQNILVVDNALSISECDSLIDQALPELGQPRPSPWNYSDYDFDIENAITSNLGIKLVTKYVKKYPEMNLTFNKWYLEHFKFKQFLPGEYYDYWHSEQGFYLPRIVSILVYLSDHKCGTEFYNSEIILSKKGRALIFPAFWTHTHRGQPCPENKVRFVMSSYISLMDDRP